MDKSAIKNFAVSARVKLKEQIKQKAYTFGITKDEIKTVEMFEDAFDVNGSKYDIRLLKYREGLVKKVNEKGLEQVLEEVAYTWFNRLIAIRFMEVNEYLPSGIRVLSSTDISKAEPDIIREAANLDFENLNIDLIYKLQDENNIDELFRYLLVKQCNELGRIMPVVFEEIEDFTELLLPDNLLQEDSIIRDLVNSINEDDWKEQVEIIGWLYQYYISEKKNEVFADLKKNIKITKENIPAATQLFTPDWIVKYMVENSLGRLWLESHQDEELKAKWKYYLDEAEQEPEVQKQLEEVRGKNKDLKPEEIKFLDPCMGSGHIIVYAFDVLYNIYKSAGYSERGIPKLILTNNLYGLDIDDRASQLAYFAVMMKARSYNRRIFREKIVLNISSIQESNDFPKEAIDFLVNSGETEIAKRIHRDDVEYLINVFNDAKEYGSILEVKEIDFQTIERRIEEIRNGETADIFELQYKNVILGKVPTLIKQAKVMSKKYDVACTNPPYMNCKGMNLKLKEYVNKNYPNSSQDFYTVFLEKGFRLLKENGLNSLVTIQTFMFLQSFEELRKELILNKTFINLIQIGYNSFPELNSKVAHAAAYIIRNRIQNEYKGTYLNLNNGKETADKELIFLERKRDNENYILDAKEFLNIPGWPISYWLNQSIKSAFKNQKALGDIANPKQGLITANNEMFVRFWYEVVVSKIGFNIKDSIEAKLSGRKWFPFNKGGDFRRWYGNNDYVVNWENDGFDIKTFVDEHGKVRSRPQNIKYYFTKGITWSVISPVVSFRYFDNGFIFSNSGQCVFTDDVNNLYYLLALLNSKVTNYLLMLLSPSMGFESGYIGKIPVYPQKNVNVDIDFKGIVNKAIEISKLDWDFYENSWNFKKHPLLIIKSNNLVRDSSNNLGKFISSQFLQLKEIQERINEIFIDLYRLENELEYVVEDKDIPVRKADKIKSIKSFISYSVGCMFGRYSLDEEGLINAGGEFNSDKYKIFKVDIDNVIPITDDEYFEDDIVSRFVEFVKITFSEETLEQNLDYIADTLGKKGNETSRQTIRRYFLKDFYKDHIKTYQKRPIYWLFDSGKNDGFKALIYMHRYDIDTVAIVRTDYLHLLQRKYEAEVNRLDMVMENDNESVREKAEAKKKKEKIQKQILECVQYDQVIAHVANQKISLDLDDGVKVNYAKFQGVEVPQGEGKKALKADLLAKI